MGLQRYFSSLRSTFYFMICFGLLTGALFPFYSAIFFGRAAFSPLYVIGCLAAGFLVGSFCYYIIKQVMRSYLERQWQTVSRIAGHGRARGTERAGDELQLLLNGYDQLMNSVLAMVEQVSTLIATMVPQYEELLHSSHRLAEGNAEQVVKVRDTLRAAGGMSQSFRQMLAETEDLSRRAADRAEVGAQLGTATDALAERIRDYSSAILETSASIEEMAITFREISANIADLTASTGETASSIAQISSSIANVRDHALRTSQCSEDVRIKAQEGMAAMTDTRRAMGDIENSNRDSQTSIKRLTVHSERVGEFLTVIQEVVKQTNLLSLNASIIAAQSGDSGKAFGVVAEEVRGLAQRTAQSAGEIQLLVDDIRRETSAAQESVNRGMERVRSGVEMSERTGRILAGIEESAVEASDMVKKIARATEEQASGSRLITGSMEKNQQRIQQITRSMQEQERGASYIVRALERMKSQLTSITTSVDEQSRGNRFYLETINEDSAKTQQLREDSQQQLLAAETVAGFITETGELVEANALQAQQIAARIGAVAQLTEQLQQELEPFRTAE
jgi:methyl-accepting chemotaxis protein